MKRKVAYKIQINEILNGTYIKRPGWEPSGVLTKYGEITRVNLTGLIVSLSEGEDSFTFLLDDGSGNITIRQFEPLSQELVLGDLVRIIGRVRESGNSIYVVPELIKKIDKKWYSVHNLELKLLKRSSKKLPVEPQADEVIETGPYQKILNVITILDKGEGVDVQEVVNNIKIQNCENIVQNLIEEGEVFEISPGRVKILE